MCLTVTIVTVTVFRMISCKILGGIYLSLSSLFCCNKGLHFFSTDGFTLEFCEAVGVVAVAGLDGRQGGEGVAGGEVAWKDVIQGLPVFPLVLVTDCSWGCCCAGWSRSGD